MKPFSLRITNFRSFAKTQTFHFPQEPGLYFMTGANESEPRLEANGAGKSTVWEALKWCVDGKTSRGLKAGDVCNWNAGKGTSVEFAYATEADEVRKVTRTWGPISWKMELYDGDVIDLTKAAENPFLADLGLGGATLLNCALMAQGQPMFLDMRADAQAALFSDVMGLDRWIGYSAEASARAAAHDASARQLERRLASAEGELEAVTRQDHRAALDAWEKARAERLDKLAIAYEMALEYQTGREELNAAEEAEQNARALVAQLMQNAPDLRHHQELQETVSDHKATLAAYRREADALTESLGSLGAECPTCGHALSKREEAEAARAVLKKVEQLADKTKRTEKAYGFARENLDKLGAEVGDHNDRLRKARDAAADAAADTAKARRQKLQEDRELDRMEEEAERAEKEENPYLELVLRAADDAERLREDVAARQRSLDDARRMHGISSMWVRGFKELRLKLIAEELTELEVEVNSCCSALGLVGWELRFQVDRETKGGSVARGFSVLVRSPHNERAVPWEAWSGGEAQRLRLAAQMGLADLIRARTGALLPLEVWDEPTRDLSEAGVQDLLESLAARARLEQRAIWIVDHRTHSFGGFAGGARIVKTPSGSRVRQDAV